MRGLTKAAALDLARYNIRVNSIHPGIINTDMTADVTENDKMILDLPMARRGEPYELAQLVLFLASDSSSYSTGSEFIADGGLTAM